MPIPIPADDLHGLSELSALAPLGIPTRRRFTARQTYRQRLHRGLQRPPARRVPERTLVFDPCRRPGKVGGLAQVLQRGSTAWGNRQQAPGFPYDSHRRIQPAGVTKAGKPYLPAVQQLGADQSTPDSRHGWMRNGGQVSISDADFLALAQRVLERDGPLYQSLTQGTALVAAPTNVENLNYLQCAWAHTAVYSNCRDFAFARHVFNKTPQYRDLVKVRLEFIEPPRDPVDR